MKDIDWSHPDWIMVAMWVCGLGLMVFTHNPIGVAVFSVAVVVRTLIAYNRSRKDIP